jgi:hypothetical protein
MKTLLKTLLKSVGLSVGLEIGIDLAFDTIRNPNSSEAQKLKLIFETACARAKRTWPDAAISVND